MRNVCNNPASYPTDILRPPSKYYLHSSFPLESALKMINRGKKICSVNSRDLSTPQSDYGQWIGRIWQKYLLHSKLFYHIQNMFLPHSKLFTTPKLFYHIQNFLIVSTFHLDKMDCRKVFSQRRWTGKWAMGNHWKGCKKSPFHLLLWWGCPPNN